MLFLEDLTKNYRVESMSMYLEDLRTIYQENPQYFEAMGQTVPTENLWEDLVAVPEGASSENKCFIGFWDGTQLVAVLEMLLDYPGEDTVYVGLFMVSAARQRTGEGSRILEEVFNWLRMDDYKRVELSYAYGNQQSENFWRKNGFVGTGDIRPLDTHVVVGMEKYL